MFLQRAPHAFRSALQAKLFIQSHSSELEFFTLKIKIRLRYYGRVNPIRAAAKLVESAKYSQWPLFRRSPYNLYLVFTMSNVGLCHPWRKRKVNSFVGRNILQLHWRDHGSYSILTPQRASVMTKFCLNLDVNVDG